jgi:hypothetical protein
MQAEGSSYDRFGNQIRGGWKPLDFHSPTY